MVGVCYGKELDDLNNFLPLKSSTESDAWTQAQPVTRITDTVYPFNARKTRPTENEVSYRPVCYMTHYFQTKKLDTPWLQLQCEVLLIILCVIC